MADAGLYWGLILIGLTLVLLLIEAFVPSGGLIAAVACVLAAAGIVVLWRYDTVWGVIGLGTVLVAVPATFFWSLHVLPNTSFGRKFFSADAEELHAARENRESEEAETKRALIGLEGVATTDLHPVGEIEVEGRVWDALADGEWIELGDRVKVTASSGMELRVRRA